MRVAIISVFFLFLVTGFSDNDSLIAQTTGKISGRVYSQSDKEPVAGANVTIDGMTLGASTDLEGEFFIINIPPGKHDVRVQMIGYETVVVQDVKVSVNRTAGIDVVIGEALLEGEEIVVIADRVSIKKDQTSSIKNVSSEEIQTLPVETIDQVVEMQAGIVQGHFRGGRSTEVSYLVDGVQTDQVFDREGQTVELETEAVQDLEVITGTFNAEYGRAMSGIVNLITKDGGSEFHGSFTGYLSNYYTTHSAVFIGLENTAIARNQDYTFSLSGPILGNTITFFMNYRYQDLQGHLNGINRFEPENYTNFIERPEPLLKYNTPWDAVIKGRKLYSEYTGDERYVAMNWNRKASFMGKLTFKPLQKVKFSMMTNLNGFNPNLDHGNEWQSYSHGLKYKPLGRETNYEKNQFYLFSLNHLVSNSLFYDAKLSYQKNYRTAFLYKDPFDERYVSDGYDRTGGGFVTGGQDKGRWERFQEDINGKLDLTWQINKNHNIKIGTLFTQYVLDNRPNEVLDLRSRTGDPTYQEFYYDPDIQRVVFSDYIPSVLPDSAVDRYKREPYEYAFYVQDKMEFDDLVINLGLRYDYFSSNTVYPSDLRNPDNLQDATRLSDYPEAKPQTQLSPRFGLSYTLGSKAVLHFSYGHFFQMPPLYAMYQNHYFLIPTGDFQTVHGNPNIKAERTVQYEMGLWQELMPGMGMEISVYYRDIYDLQSAIVMTTYSGRKYGVFSNKDYGNVKGMELKFDYFMNPIIFFLNYTLQYTRGVADNPNSTFNRLGQSIDPISRLTPLAWDQRHTLNFSVNYSKNNYGATLTTYYNSGLPYTFVPILESPLSKQDIPPNGEKRPSTVTLDLKSHYIYEIMEKVDLVFNLSVYNLLDTKNELFVNSTTGRAYSAIIRESQIVNFRSNYNDIYDSIKNPAMFSAPREVKLGLGIRF